MRALASQETERMLAAVDRAKRDRTIFTDEHRVIRVDNGEVVWLSPFGQFQYDGAGDVIRFVGVFFDISARKKAEERSRHSEEEFRATFEQAAVGPAHVGLDGRWLLVNRRLCEIVGYDPHELLGMTFQDITHPDDIASDLVQVRRVLTGEIETCSMEKRYYRKNRSLVWVNLTVSLVRTTDDPTHFVFVAERGGGRVPHAGTLPSAPSISAATRRP